MSDYMQQINEATVKLSELQGKEEAITKEMISLEASARAHEHQARQDSMERTKKKLEREAIAKDKSAIELVLKNANVGLRIESAEQKAHKAQADAEAVLASNLETQKKLNELLAEVNRGK